MSYKINRLIKSQNREGKDEIFVDLQITDDLGTYPYGKWLDQEEMESFKKDFGKAGFDAAKNLGEFKFLNKDLPALHTIISDHLPRARQLKEENDYNETIDRRKKEQELNRKDPLTKEDRELIKAELREELKEELKSEILKELKG